MPSALPLSLDPQDPAAAPYFTWDAPVTNAEIRRLLATGSQEDRLRWTAHIMREARYDHVWVYLSLTDDILPQWQQLLPRLGRRREMWAFLIRRWRDLGLIPPE